MTDRIDEFDPEIGALIEFKLKKSPYLATVFIYDDGRDVFLDLDCETSIEDSVMTSVNKITPFTRSQNSPYLPTENPSPYVLVAAAEAARDTLINNGYKLVSEKRSYLQLGS
ncbi:peptidase C24 [Vibrio vulnificus]|uniref:hypothetical protein n=1 Tax=Vibrio vulnificus TaxID=672 RepID=UPI000A20B104|nr:hypothetical protein [Vibrio vulnificus]ARN64665.1 peptidase C24 [Vibrio vulnificus]